MRGGPDHHLDRGQQWARAPRRGHGLAGL